MNSRGIRINGLDLVYEYECGVPSGEVECVSDSVGWDGQHIQKEWVEPEYLVGDIEIGNIYMDSFTGEMLPDSYKNTTISGRLVQDIILEDCLKYLNEV